MEWFRVTFKCWDRKYGLKARKAHRVWFNKFWQSELRDSMHLCVSGNTAHLSLASTVSWEQWQDQVVKCNWLDLIPHWPPASPLSPTSQTSGMSSDLYVYSWKLGVHTVSVPIVLHTGQTKNSRHPLPIPQIPVDATKVEITSKP